jgi:ATP-dependent DNA helicase RecG
LTVASNLPPPENRESKTAAGNPALEKLVKYLRLEADRGYDNRAVVGGLERMLDPWQSEARTTGLPPALIDVVVGRLRDYPRLTPASRGDMLRGLWNRLRAEFPSLFPRTPATGIAEAEAAATATPVEPAPAPAVAAAPAPEPVAPEAEAEAEPAVPEAEAETEPEPDEDEDDEEEPEMEAEVEALPGAETSEARVPSGPPGLEAPLTAIAGIGPKSAKTLERLGLRVLGDLLWHLPRRYDDYSKLKTISRLWYGEDVTIIATVDDIHVRPTRGGRVKLVEATVSDGTGALRVTWFNQPWIADRLRPGRAVVMSGRVEQYLGRLTMNSPEWEPVERQQLHTNRIVPVYPLTSGVTAKWLRRVISSVVGRMAPRLPDPLPEAVRSSAGLMGLGAALQQVHFPDSWEQLEAAQQRLAFDEMLFLQLGVQRQKREWAALSTLPLSSDDAWTARFTAALPFPLTEAQTKALQDVRTDLARTRPMNRLLQGDVGSGKTVIAAAAIGIAAANGAQAAVMAPTSILAEQHYQTLLSLLPQAASIPVDRIRLLLGSTPAAEKDEIRRLLASGELSVVIGTHALLEDPVTFSRLGVAVIDEQHRFGVEQRGRLRAKGGNPHLLVMTATPIPRSLALTLYGDLDLSVMDEMPPGRLPIETRVLQPVERSRAYSFIRGQVDAGRQAFVIYPLVEGSDKVEAKAAVEEHERLQAEVFPQYRLGLLHGRMRPDEKDEGMGRFRSGEVQILVSTSVVEVGVDVPNATVILIEGANRFGLAQLHQFRGRIGRGPYPSFCLLIPDAEDEAENARLKAMEATSDGFELAELDLSQRGPGEFLGSQQSGFADLRMARLTDVRLIEKARRQAEALFEADPDLSKPEHALLAGEVERFWSTKKGDIS